MNYHFRLTDELVWFHTPKVWPAQAVHIDVIEMLFQFFHNNRNMTNLPRISRIEMDTLIDAGLIENSSTIDKGPRFDAFYYLYYAEIMKRDKS